MYCKRLSSFKHIQACFYWGRDHNEGQFTATGRSQASRNTIALSFREVWALLSGWKASLLAEKISYHALRASITFLLRRWSTVGSIKQRKHTGVGNDSTAAHSLIISDVKVLGGRCGSDKRVVKWQVIHQSDASKASRCHTTLEHRPHFPLVLQEYGVE